jgi:hypothetical protein|tara:strand:- start:6707 stop:6850 length:144 start_codon:yes stop_codon:yes gene_type:complete
MSRLSKIENSATLKEITTPATVAGYGRLYPKNDDNLYFLDVHIGVKF